ncbi:hypothetical protein B0T17DRAFT_605317 [Bombardia bombarda]|uniref:Aminoglycoside phosphotransferase domain-containing protein n=1 Tax=Bombardia bombarda TaxID=252184 RepID=A0AA39XMB0_9PEZI|nr:hypothetical protein B0T17DRAFT_605317 [Bombardia bombarda]
MPTGRPCDTWTRNFESVAPDCEHVYMQMGSVLAHANQKSLQDVALAVRSARTSEFDKSATCTISTITPGSGTWGIKNLIFEVKFSDGVCWIVKVQYLPPKTHRSISQAQSATRALASEIATMKVVRDRTTIPIPDIVYFDTSASNFFGYPFFIMDSTKGFLLGSPIAASVPNEKMPHVAQQMADVLFQLQNLTFDRLGRIWCGENCDVDLEIIPVQSDLKLDQPETTSTIITNQMETLDNDSFNIFNGSDDASDDDLFDEFISMPDEENKGTVTTSSTHEWVHELRMRENKAILAQHGSDRERVTACWVLYAAMSYFLQNDRAHGPFPLCHLDLYHGNLLFDNDFNLVGITDWSDAQTVPLERLAVSPEFVTFPFVDEERKEKTGFFAKHTRECLVKLEESQYDTASASVPRLSTIFGQKTGTIALRCLYSLPHNAVGEAKEVVRLVTRSKGKMPWDQMVARYGNSDDLPWKSSQR